MKSIILAVLLGVVLAPGEPKESSVNTISLPLKQWVALAPPSPWANGTKHVVIALNPDNGRLYLTGGDYSGGPGSTGQTWDGSYRQATWSLSLAERFVDLSNRDAGLRLEYDDCGPSNQIQPKHPDFTGWRWDPNRHVFWMIPGQMSGSNNTCAGETTPGVSDQRFLFGHLMTFDPVARVWADFGPVPGVGGDQWDSVYDPAGDKIIRFRPNQVVQTYDVAARTWSSKTLSGSATVNDGDFDRGLLAADFVQRVIYTIDPYQARLFRYSMNAGSMEDLGPIPGGRLVDDWAQPMVIWDSINDVLLWYRHPDGTAFPQGGFAAYHPSTRTWETLSVATDKPGLTVSGLVIGFDYLLNAVVLLQRKTIGTSSTINMYLYRYGNGSGSAPPPSPAPPAPPAPPPSGGGGGGGSGGGAPPPSSGSGDNHGGRCGATGLEAFLAILLFRRWFR